MRAFDLRPGGAFHTFLRGPDGGSSDNPGAFLEVVPQSRIAFTSMLLGGWRPATPWMPFTAIITLADEGEGTRYVAKVMHADRRRATATRRWASSTAGTPASTSSRPSPASARRAEAATPFPDDQRAAPFVGAAAPSRASADDDGGRGVHRRAATRMRCESPSSWSTTTATE